MSNVPVRLARGSAVWLLFLAAGAPAWPASGPAEATVFIRVRGDIRAVQAYGGPFERQDVEVATGSGFVITPSGHVLTCSHLVVGGERTAHLGGVEVRITVDVTRIEVVTASGPGQGPERSMVASVVADDPALDLALLQVPAGDLPRLPLADSDALVSGQNVTAWGFPLGRKVEIGRAPSSEVVPLVSANPGHVSALRSDEGGDVRFIQTDAAINPGNSGGPLVNEDGHAVGVVGLKRQQAEGVGFAVPINLAKDFLAAQGLESWFPRRLRLGPPEGFEGKGLRLRLPEGFADVSSAHLRWDSGGGPEEIALVIDRVASPLGLPAIEAHLLSGKTFGGVPAARLPAARPSSEGRVILGSARGSGSAGPEELEFALVDLGTEKIVARYAGPAEQVAFNRAVLRRSLASLEADPLLKAPVAAPLTATFERIALRDPGAPAIPMPRGWTRGDSADAPPPGLTAADSRLSTFPDGDFTVSLQASWWRSISPGSKGEPLPYTREVKRLGMAYDVEGVFVRVGRGMLLLELSSPRPKQGFVRGLFQAWVEATRAALAGGQAGDR